VVEGVRASTVNNAFFVEARRYSWAVFVAEIEFRVDVFFFESVELAVESEATTLVGFFASVHDVIHVRASKKRHNLRYFIELH